MQPRTDTPSTDEKAVGVIEPYSPTPDPNDPDAGKTPEEREKIDKDLVRRLDWRLIPWLSLLYLVSFIDRANIGNAKIEGLVDDLKMSPMQYNNTLSIFFVSYSVFEPASNILLKKMRPRIYIPMIIIGWGIVMLCMGFVKNYGGMLTARWFLGMTEAGLYPGVNYYLSCWYKRNEFGIRAAIFLSAAAVSGSFGGLLAAAISQMDGIGGIRGWAWIFILEGAATILIGITSFWLVYDFPDLATFLSPDDRYRVMKRLREDGQASANHESFNMKYLWQALKDPKTYIGALIYMGVDGALYAFSLFLPSIIATLGYSSTRAQLMTVPPYVVACALTIGVGWLADRTGKRGIFNITLSWFGIVGFLILLVSTSGPLSYAATFLAALGIYPLIANSITWVANNTEGVYKRGVTLGCVIGWGNLNGVMSSNVYRDQDKPHYRMGHAFCLGYLAIGLFGGSVLNYWYLWRENKKRRNGERDYLLEGEMANKTQKEQEDELGDMRPNFFYTL